MLHRLKDWISDYRDRHAERLSRLGWTIEECRRIGITAGPDGIEVHNVSSRDIHNTPQSIGWSDFDQIYVFKRDRMTVDDICMAFDRDGCTVLEVNEETIGWRPLIAALPEYLEGVMDADEWFAKVVRPAFAPCTTLIYDAAARTG